MLHPIDRLLFEGKHVPPEVLARELAKPWPRRGDSYWGDALWDLADVIAPANLGSQAVVLARRILFEDASRIEAALSP